LVAELSLIKSFIHQKKKKISPGRNLVKNWTQ